MTAFLTAENIIELGRTMPWFLVCVVLFFAIRKFVYWCGDRLNNLYELLFDKDQGKFVQLLNTQTEFVNSVKQNNEYNRGDIVRTLESIKAIEDRLTHMSRVGFENMNSEYFSVLFERNPVPICFVDENGKFISANIKCTELLGFSSEELQHKTFIDVTALADVATDKLKAEKVKNGEISYYRLEKTYVRKNGDTVYCALYVYRIPNEGPFNHYISIIAPLGGEFQVR